VINSATRTLDAYNEEINDKECINALTAATKRGVAVRVIAADLGSNGQNKNVPALATLTAADNGTNDQIAYIGSEYFGHVSLDQNWGS